AGPSGARMGGRLLRRAATAGAGRGGAGGCVRGQGAGGGRRGVAAAARGRGGGAVSAPAPLLPTIAADVAAGRRSAADTARAALDAIREADGGPEGLNAFLSAGGAAVEEAAAAVDEAIRRGDAPGPLAGVPVAVKDNLCTVA